MRCASSSRSPTPANGPTGASSSRTHPAGATARAFSFGLEGPPLGPLQRPARLVANHQSFSEPGRAGQAAGKPICYLARSTLFKNPIHGAMLRSVNVVPVEQEGVAKEG